MLLCIWTQLVDRYYLYLNHNGAHCICKCKYKFTIIVDEVTLEGEGEYNLNVLKEIVVTDSYMRLDEDIRGCQNEEAFYDCTTRLINETILKQCGCISTINHLDHQDIQVFRLSFVTYVLLHFPTYSYELDLFTRYPGARQQSNSIVSIKF